MPGGRIETPSSLLCSVLVLSASTAPLSLAQSKLDSESPSGTDSTIEEIIVSATRREKSLQDVPVSVGVLTDEKLAAAGATHIYEYWRMIPSLSVVDRGLAGNRFVIRGLTGSPGNENDESMTAMYLDDTFLASPQALFAHAPSFQAVDLERIEVLRGPQGTLFGANAMGGAIRMITNKPDPSEALQIYELTLSQTAHGGTNYGVSGVINFPLSQENSAIRLAAYRFDNDGFIDDIGSGEKNANANSISGVRISISKEINENLTIGAKFAYEDIQLESFPYVDPNGKPSVGLPITGDYQVALMADDYRDEQNTVVSVDLQYSSGIGDVTAVTSFFESETTLVFDFSSILNSNPFFGSYLPSMADGSDVQNLFSQEIRIVVPESQRLSWQAGIYYAEMDFDLGASIIAPGVNAICGGCTGLPDGEEYLIVNDIDDARTEFGVFADLSYSLTEKLEATVGARWYDLDRQSTEISTGAFSNFLDPLSTTQSSRAFSDSGLVGKGALSYRPNDYVTLYALAAQGFRPGGANELFAATTCSVPETFDSDDLWNYEVGVKARLYENSVSLNVAAYAIDWSDAQLMLALPPPCLGNVAVNSGGVSIEGLEFETAMIVNEHWELSVGVGLTNATLDKDLPEISAPAGRRLAYVPDFTANGSATYRFSAFGDERFHLRADYQYVGRQYNEINDFGLVPRQELPAYSLLNLRLGADFDAWRLSLFADNVFDERAEIHCCEANGEFVINRPRTVGVRFRYNH